MKKILKYPWVWIVLILAVAFIAMRRRQKAPVSLHTQASANSQDADYMDPSVSNYSPQGGPTMTGFAAGGGVASGQ